VGCDIISICPNTCATAVLAGRSHLANLAEELRTARLNAGLSQQSVADACRLSRAEVGRIERREAPWLDIVTAAELCAVVGLDLWIRAYPGGDPLRDAAHVALMDRFLSWVAPPLSVRLEVPLGIPGDTRAWDAMLSDRTETVGAEAETRITDGQALERRLALKRRDGRIDRLVIVVADTRANRAVLRATRQRLRADYPLDTADVLDAIRAGRLPAAGGVALI
jgi:transcriptional regulator with XRE-family HTH domain